MEKENNNGPKDPVSKQQLAGNMFIYVLGGILPQAINFLFLPVFSRLLSPSDFGVLGYVASVTAFLTVTNSLSLNSFYLRSYFQSEDKKRFTGSIFYFLLIFNFVFILLEAIILKHVFARLHIQVAFSPFMQLGLLECFFSAVSIIPLRYYRLEFNAGRYFCFCMGQVVLAQSLGLYFVYFLHWGAAGRLWGSALAALVAAVFYLFDVRRYAHFIIDQDVIQKGLRFSMPLVLGTYATMMVGISDRFILERFVPLDQLGIYSISCSLSSLIAVLISALLCVLEPMVYRISDSENFLTEYLRYKDYAYFIVFSGVAFLIIFSREIIYFFLSAKFQPAAVILPVVAFSYVFAVARENASLLLMVKNKTFSISLITLITAAVSVILNLVFIPKFGIMAAACVAVVSALVGVVLTQGLVKGSMKIDLGIKRDCLAVAVLVLLMVVIRATTDYASVFKLAIEALSAVLWGVFVLKCYRISWGMLWDTLSFSKSNK